MLCQGAWPCPRGHPGGEGTLPGSLGASRLGAECVGPVEPPAALESVQEGVLRAPRSHTHLCWALSSTAQVQSRDQAMQRQEQSTICQGGFYTAFHLCPSSGGGRRRVSPAPGPVPSTSAEHLGHKIIRGSRVQCSQAGFLLLPSPIHLLGHPRAAFPAQE